MFEVFEEIFKNITLDNFNVLLLIGLAIFGGTVGGQLFQRVKIPQVVGYIIIGLIVGRVGFNLIDEKVLTILEPISYFALGIIGFMIGGELKKELMAKYGKQFLYILLSEGITAFLFVSIVVFVITYLILQNFLFAISLGLVLGAISSATAPAATVDVLWEYKTAGPLTNTILGIVALDDVLALLLFVLVSNFVGILSGVENQSFVGNLLKLGYEIIGAVILGFTMGYVLSIILKRMKSKERLLSFSLGNILLLIGLAQILKIDLILASMVLGITLVNLVPKRSAQLFNLVRDFTPPIYVLFFVMVGAKLYNSSFKLVLLLLIAGYVLGRTAGKMLGAKLGAKLAKSNESISKYLPYCLFSQAGIAIGLSILATKVLEKEISDLVVTVVTATTFVVQVIGPIFVKYAVKKAGEVGLNITEEDLIKSSKVRDVIDKEFPVIIETTPLSQILDMMSKYPYYYYPVVTTKNELLGIVTIENLKNTFAVKGLNNFLVAYDLVEPVVITAKETTPLEEALELMRLHQYSYLTVVDETAKHPIGIIEDRVVSQLIAKRIKHLHEKASAA